MNIHTNTLGGEVSKSAGVSHETPTRQRGFQEIGTTTMRRWSSVVLWALQRNWTHCSLVRKPLSRNESHNGSWGLSALDDNVLAIEGFVVVIEDFLHEFDEVIQSEEVAILSVAFHPRRAVRQCLTFRQGRRLAEVYNPHTGLTCVVMHEQQWTSNHLKDQGGKGLWSTVILITWSMLQARYRSSWFSTPTSALQVHEMAHRAIHSCGKQQL